MGEVTFSQFKVLARLSGIPAHDCPDLINIPTPVPHGSGQSTLIDKLAELARLHVEHPGCCGIADKERLDLHLSNLHYPGRVAGAFCDSLRDVAPRHDPWNAVWIVGLLYFFIWEASQLYIARFSLKLLADSVLDTVAVVFGCVAAAYLSDGAVVLAILSWAASFTVAAVGWWLRE